MSNLFSSPSSSEHFELEARIANIYSCIDLIQQTLIDCSPCAKRKQAKRRCIPDTIFQQTLKKIKLRWLNCLDRLFELPVDEHICDKIAHHLIGAFCVTRERYDVKDDHYRLAMNTAITPIIGCIMDEQEMSKESWDRQERRKYFLVRLMSTIASGANNDTTSSNSNVSQTCAPSTSTQGRNGSGNTNCSSGRSLLAPADGDESAGKESNGQCCTSEGMLILDILFDALERHANHVLRVDLDIQKQIFHIMNITHVVEIVMQKFKEIKINLKVCAELDLGDGQSIDTKRLLESVLRYEAKVMGIFQFFDIDNPMVIFRQDLRNILILMMTMKPLLNHNEI